MSKILIGADPEVFVKKAGIFVSAYGLIRGDKKNPQKVHRGAVQVDGMALEFNIDPADSENEFCISVQQVFNHLKTMVPDYEVVATPVADFTHEYIKAQPAAAKELGCDPDFNAWQRNVNIKPNGDLPMRTASGHLHIGWGSDMDINSDGHHADCAMVTKNADFFLALPSLFYDDDTRRREMYGKAGCYRPKSYGVEYRTLSNAWLKSEELMRWAYRASQACMAATMAGNFLFDRHGDIQDIINNSRKDEAYAIIKAEGLEICGG